MSNLYKEKVESNLKKSFFVFQKRCICCGKLSNEMWRYHRIGNHMLTTMNFYTCTSCSPSKADAVDMFYEKLEKKPILK